MATPRLFSQIHSFDSCLGYGAFGIVLKVTDNLQKETAIKLLFPNDSPSEQDQKRILRETLAEEYEHENVVQTINFESKILTYKELEKILQVLPQEMNKYKYQFLGQARINGEIETICIQMELCGENLRNWLDQDNDREDIKVQKMQIIIPGNIIAEILTRQ
jgi:serine/threonine protein kinase